MDDANQIRALLADVNAAWLHGPPAEIVARIAPYVADDAVIVGPDLARVARGRDAFCRSYADFVAVATIDEFASGDVEVDCSGAVAAATFRWRMRYSVDGAAASEAGCDVYVLAQRNGRWLITWRKLESYPAQ